MDVTGVGQDAWANSHRIPVEEGKPANERGFYLHPELYGVAREANQVGTPFGNYQEVGARVEHSDVTRKRLGTNTRQWLAEGAH